MMLKPNTMHKSVFMSATLTETQQRRHNEDFYDYLWVDGVGCWVVADGLGGHQGGEVASQLTVKSVITAFASQPEISAEALTRYLLAAHNALLRRQREEPRLSGMRTTIVLLLADPEIAIWTHAGDSRLYHFRGGRIINRTKDHSVAQALVNSGEIKAEELRGHEDRHRLLRALGQEDDFRPAILKDKQPLEWGDAFLLCTDGFWEMVLEAEMEEDLESVSTPKEWLERMQKRIDARTLTELNKNHDNYTAMAIIANQT
jgi:serine/threonine protein phosphatase PrpC